MPNAKMAIKVDVDTLMGLKKGLPNLLGIFDKFNIKATIFIPLGPDNSGKAIRRVFKKSFLKKMWRTNVVSTYGIKTLLYGTLLPPPMIAASFPEVIKEAKWKGHELGIHCYDHVKWHDLLDKLSYEEIKEELQKASSIFEEILGMTAHSFAAPGWKINKNSLKVEDEYQMLYCSDTRGYYPFIPRMEGLTFTTLQIPTTLPTMDEIFGVNGIDDSNINDFFMSRIRTDGINVHTIHAEIEGIGKKGIFEEFLKRLKKSSIEIMTLEEIAVEQLKNRDNIPINEISQEKVPGRSGIVGLQKTDINVFSNNDKKIFIK